MEGLLRRRPHCALVKAVYGKLAYSIWLATRYNTIAIPFMESTLARVGIVLIPGAINARSLKA